MSAFWTTTRDAAEKAAECVYLPALDLMEDGLWTEAMAEFNRIPDYPESRRKILECHYHLGEEAERSGELQTASSEYLMAGINTIAPGQIEAARALGMTFPQIIRGVVIPQALRSSVLPLTNLLTATMLTTALASQVPMKPRDLTGLVSHINTHAVGGVMAFLISASLYCATAVVIGQIGNLIDRKVRILR